MKAEKFYSLSWLIMIAFGMLNFSNPGTGEEVTLHAEISGCGNTLHLYSFDGFGFEQLHSAESEDGVFSFSLPKTDPGFFYIGPSERKVSPIILGQEDQVNIKASCHQLRQMQFLDSPINNAYLALKKKMEDYNRKNNSLIRSIQMSRNNPDNKAVILEKLKELDEERLSFLHDTKKEDPFFGSIIALNTYLSFPHNGQDYDNELDYFAETFFKYADFEEPIYAKIPWTYESFKGYANTLSTVGLPDDLHKVYLDKALSKVPSGSAAQKLAYAGVLSILKQRKHNNYVYFTEQFIERFKQIDPATTGRLKKEVSLLSNLMVGGTAPDFSQETPEGEPLRLSDLRGKVVLIDFWASWCGPCRAENPNVVKVYEKYREKGFEILGVSLDNKRDRWLKAIKADELTWPQVSDLKGWQNEVAQAYGVHSIPQTILLDPEGKIIARNLRGQRLEQKLAELFDQ